jgi:hypothetical protein
MAMLAVALLLPCALVAQASSDTAGARVRVFLDCSGFDCESDFFQTELPYVSHVRDRSDADVHVLITRERTGSGGRQYTLEFIGHGRFQGSNATLHALTEPNSSDDRVRQTLARSIELGLVRYVADSPEGARLKVSYDAPQGAAAAAAPPRRDPWKQWTFKVGGNGYFNGEQKYSSRSLSGSLSASRVTERWKLRLASSLNESRSRFEIDSATSYHNTTTSRNASGLLVRSLGPHLSAGAVASASRSSYFNQRLAVRAAPAVEYDVFPYAQSTRRLLSVRYSAGPAWYEYEERTIYGRTSERRLQHSLVAEAVARQPWGSVNASAEGSQFLDNLAQNRVELGGGVELNLVRGLALNVFGNYERLRDQLYLPAGDAPEDEVLLRRRQLATGFRYFMGLGLSYTFGSRFSSVVNPRFNGVD